MPVRQFPATKPWIFPSQPKKHADLILFFGVADRPEAQNSCSAFRSLRGFAHGCFNEGYQRFAKTQFSFI